MPTPTMAGQSRRADQQVHLGGEVVQQGAAGHVGQGQHLGGGGLRVSALDQGLDGGVQDFGPGRPAALCLGSPAGFRCHGIYRTP